MPQISIQLVTFNNATTIETSVRSVLEQVNVDYELVIIDNASSDDTLARLTALGVSAIRNPRNVGYAAAHNQALQHGTAPYVMTLNPDVWLTPNYLYCIIGILDSNERLGSAAGCLLRVEHLGGPALVLDSTGLLMTRSRRQRLANEGVLVERRPTQCQPIFGPDGAAAVYRRAMLEDIQVKGEVFDADFFMHKEDIDVCWRAQLRGWSSIYVPEAIAHHVRHFRPGQRQGVAPYMRFLGVRNRYLLMLKNEIPPHFWRDFGAIAWYDLKILVYLLCHERQSLKAFWSAWQLRHRMAEKRRSIQMRRTVRWQDLRPWFSI